MQQGDYIEPETIKALGSLMPADQEENLQKLYEQISRFDTDDAMQTLLGIASRQQINLSNLEDNT